MKNPSQIRAKSRGGTRAAQAIPRQRRFVRRAPKPGGQGNPNITTHGGRKPIVAHDYRITIKAHTDLPGVIYRRDQGGTPIKVQTGQLEWTIEQFSAALRSGRFLITVLPQFHRLAVANIGSDRIYAEFLTLLTKVHLAELRDSIPLYWIEEVDPASLILISLRGSLPNNRNRAFAARSKALLAGEMARRGIDAHLCSVLDRLESLSKSNPAALKEFDKFVSDMLTANARQRTLVAQEGHEQA